MSATINQKYPHINFGGCGTFSYYLGSVIQEKFNIDPEYVYIESDTPPFGKPDYDVKFSHILLKIDNWLLDNNGKYTIGTRAAYGHRLENQGSENVEIPVETAKNLQSGTYHIQDDGSWKYVGELDNPNTMKYINDVRQINHIEKPYEKKPFDIFNYGGKNYKKDRNSRNMLKYDCSPIVKLYKEVIKHKICMQISPFLTSVIKGYLEIKSKPLLE